MERIESAAMSSVVVMNVALGLVFGGGLLCAILIDAGIPVGIVALWPLGALSAWLVNRLVKSPRAYVGILLVLACVCAFVVAEVVWIHWNIEGATSLKEAAAMFPQFLKEYQFDSIIGALFAAFGAHAAYTGIRREPAS